MFSVSALCALAQPWEGFVIGSIGAVIGLVGIEGLDRLHVDDPVGKRHVHKNRKDNRPQNTE